MSSGFQVSASIKGFAAAELCTVARRSMLFTSAVNLSSES